MTRASIGLAFHLLSKQFTQKEIFNAEKVFGGGKRWSSGKKSKQRDSPVYQIPVDLNNTATSPRFQSRKGSGWSALNPSQAHNIKHLTFEIKPLSEEVTASV